MEIWNAYTADGQLTDHTLTSGEPIPHGLYHLVVECIIRHRDGSTRRAYALTNRMEYFAELSEAYLGVNDFQPFDRAELQRYDPQGFALMEKVWRN